MRTLSAAFLLAFVLVGCEFQAESNSYKPASYYAKEGEQLVECISKLDSSDRIVYYVSQATEYHPTDIPVDYIKYIKDVNGRMVSINSMEAENYTCVNHTTVTP